MCRGSGATEIRAISSATPFEDLESLPKRLRPRREVHALDAGPRPVKPQHAGVRTDVLPPISRYYDGVFKPVFWKTYVDDFMAAANSTGAPYWDYGADERFREDGNFANSLMLNRKGRARFTAEIVRRIREELS